MQKQELICSLCPRRCPADRVETPGFCGAGARAVVARAMIHRWEEPPISGTRGSGAVFFVGCNLRCVYCQNFAISRRQEGEAVSPARLADIFFELKAQGVHNVNLVTPSHHMPAVAEAVALAKKRDIGLPFVYNTNAYENADALRRLDGLIDVYLPDIKYFDDESARRYSGAEGYFEAASAAVLEMARQAGPAVFSPDGLMLRGLLIRHLVLPGLRRDSQRVLDWIAALLPDAYVSLMAQYVPVHRACEYPEINRRVTTFEYESVVAHFHKLGLKNGFVQRRDAAVEGYIPAF